MGVKDKLKLLGDITSAFVTGAFGLDTLVQNLAVEHQQHIHDITSSNSIEIGYFRAIALAPSILRVIIPAEYNTRFGIDTGAASAFCFGLLSYTSINDAIADPKPYNLFRAAFDIGCVVFNAYLAYDAHKEIQAQRQLTSQKTT